MSSVVTQHDILDFIKSKGGKCSREAIKKQFELKLKCSNMHTKLYGLKKSNLIMFDDHDVEAV